jgi:hypothetical protein
MNAPEKIDDYIAQFKDWRGDILAKFRQLIRQADPEITEEWKWNSPVWSHDGMVVSISAFKDHVGINFFQGAALKDPHHLFDKGQSAKVARAINLKQDYQIDEDAFGELVRTAVAHNKAA